MKNKEIKNVALLSRVSTNSQSNDSAIKELELLAQKNHWNIVDRYIETVSGTKGVDERSELNRMLLDAKRKQFDCLCIWELSRLCRSMSHLVQIVQELEDAGVVLFSYREGISTDTHSGRMFTMMLGVLADFERRCINDRIKRGIQHYQDKGGVMGRNKEISDELEERIVQLKSEGHSFRKVAEICNVSLGMVQRTIKRCA